MYLNALTYYNNMNFTIFLLPLIQITQLLNPVIYSDFIVSISNTTYALTEYMNKESVNMLNIYYPIMNDDILEDIIQEDNIQEDINGELNKYENDDWMI